jgi:hypothetical protein
MTIKAMRVFTSERVLLLAASPVRDVILSTSDFPKLSDGVHALSSIFLLRSHK